MPLVHGFHGGISESQESSEDVTCYRGVLYGRDDRGENRDDRAYIYHRTPLCSVWRESTSEAPSQFVMESTAPWMPLLLHALRPGPSALAPLFELPRRHPFPVDLNRRDAALKAARSGAALQRLLEHPL